MKMDFVNILIIFIEKFILLSNKHIKIDNEFVTFLTLKFIDNILMIFPIVKCLMIFFYKNLKLSNNLVVLIKSY